MPNFEVLENLPLYEKIPQVKSYLNILNGTSNQDIEDLRFMVFLTVHGYLTIFRDANIAEHSLVHSKSKCVGIYSLSYSL